MLSSINKVRNRKKNKILEKDGINYGRVIAMQTYDPSKKAMLKEFVRLCCFNYTCEINGNQDSKKCLFYSLRSAKRNDYDEIIALFRKSNPDFYEMDLVQFKSIKNIFLKLGLLVINLLRFGIGQVDDTILSALVATQYMTLNMQLKKEQIINEVDVLVTFCDAFAPDNLITQIALNNGHVTATLQHGQYRILSPGNEIADAEAYENFISDYMLTWGQATVDEFNRVGIDSNRLIKVGALRSFSSNKRIENNVEQKTFGVVLSGETYKETNVSIIKLANEVSKKYKLKYFLRMHPRNVVDYYLKYCDESALCGYSSNIGNHEYATMVDFSFIHMTGVFVELLSINSPIIMFKDSLLEQIFWIDPYCVRDIEQFDKFYMSFLSNKEKVLEEQYKKYLYFNMSGDLIANNYRVAIQNIILNRRSNSAENKN